MLYDATCELTVLVDVVVIEGHVKGGWDTQKRSKMHRYMLVYVMCIQMCPNCDWWLGEGRDVWV